MQQTFTEFKNDFYKRVPDLTLFDCGEINLLKVVLDGLKVNYISKGKVRSFAFYNIYFFRVICFFKNIIYKKKEGSNHTKSILVFDSNRTLIDENNEYQSVYFKHIIDSLLRKNVFIIKETISKCNEYDAEIIDIQKQVGIKAFSLKQKSILEQLKSTFSNIEKSKIFNVNELKNIQFAIHKFFIEFVAFDNFLIKNTIFKTAILTCHYHKEGLIYALKKNNINVVELQHGLIAEQDIFYILPKHILKTKKDLLFANYIGVYGEYWKNKLLKGYEYNDQNIFILGNYQFEPFIKNEEYNQLLNISKTKKILVVTTQTFLHKEYIELINSLSLFLNNNKLDYYIIVKPHPNEDKIVYINSLNKFKYCVVTTLPVSTLFQFAKINITSYSTTVYDALKHEVKNYVFKLPQTEDYVTEILKDGIATELVFDANLNFFDNNSPYKKNNSFYTKYNTDELFKLTDPSID